MAAPLRLKLRGFGKTQELQIDPEVSWAEFRCLVASAFGLYENHEAMGAQERADPADHLQFRSGVPVPKPLLVAEPDRRLQGILRSGELVFVSLDASSRNLKEGSMGQPSHAPAAQSRSTTVIPNRQQNPLDPLQYLTTTGYNHSSYAGLPLDTSPSSRRSVRQQQQQQSGDGGGVSRFQALLQAEKDHIRHRSQQKQNKQQSKNQATDSIEKDKHHVSPFQQQQQQQLPSPRPCMPQVSYPSPAAASSTAATTRNVGKLSRLLRSPSFSPLPEPAADHSSSPAAPPSAVLPSTSSPSAASSETTTASMQQAARGSSRDLKPARKKRKLGTLGPCSQSTAVPSGSGAGRRSQAHCGDDDDFSADLDARRDSMVENVLLALSLPSSAFSDRATQQGGDGLLLEGMSRSEARTFRSKLREDVEKMHRWRRGSHRYAAALAGFFTVRVVARNLGGGDYDAGGGAPGGEGQVMQTPELIREKRMKALAGRLGGPRAAEQSSSSTEASSASSSASTASSFGRLCVIYGTNRTPSIAGRLLKFNAEHPYRPPPEFQAPPPLSNAANSATGVIPSERRHQADANSALLATSKSARKKLLRQRTVALRPRLPINAGATSGDFPSNLLPAPELSPSSNVSAGAPQGTSATPLPAPAQPRPTAQNEPVSAEPASSPAAVSRTSPPQQHQHQPRQHHLPPATPTPSSPQPPPPPGRPELSATELETLLREHVFGRTSTVVERYPCFGWELFRHFLVATFRQAGVFRVDMKGDQEQSGGAKSGTSNYDSHGSGGGRDGPSPAIPRLSLDPEFREHLRPFNLAEFSPTIFWNMVHHFGRDFLGPPPEGSSSARGLGSDGSMACWHRLFPQLDWEWMRSRRRGLSRKARENLELRESGVLSGEDEDSDDASGNVDSTAAHEDVGEDSNDAFNDLASDEGDEGFVEEAMRDADAEADNL